MAEEGRDERGRPGTGSSKASWKTAVVDGGRRGRNATSGHMTPLDQPATLLSSYFRLVARVRTSPRVLFLPHVPSVSFLFSLSRLSINARHHKSVTNERNRRPHGRLSFVNEFVARRHLRSIISNAGYTCEPPVEKYR